MSEQQQEEHQGDGEASRIEALDERFGRIESEQAEHRSKLDQILDIVGGKGPAKPAHDKAQQHTETRLEHPPAESIAEQVRRAVADVDAERAQKERDATHQADHDKIRELAERPPREQVSGARGRLQRIMFGADR